MKNSQIDLVGINFRMEILKSICKLYGERKYIV